MCQAFFIAEYKTSDKIVEQIYRCKSFRQKNPQNGEKKNIKNTYDRSIGKPHNLTCKA